MATSEDKAWSMFRIGPGLQHKLESSEWPFRVNILKVKGGKYSPSGCQFTPSDVMRLCYVPGT